MPTLHGQKLLIFAPADVIQGIHPRRSGAQCPNPLIPHIRARAFGAFGSRCIGERDLGPKLVGRRSGELHSKIDSRALQLTMNMKESAHAIDTPIHRSGAQFRPVSECPHWAPSPQLVKCGRARSGCEKTRGISKWKS
ncbi:hypothetical protein THAOC_15193 [Thalassiosira oceanica]|uniref:Uncharacterized protein n=1 Tax=Thalassiosira oceanica TaxID=159749 RepID=K0T0Y3_THAOC|nr:hypothetical protein THAOC_15193 [Thalassiosira oceanica]|eukprot:EJK64107.1 hypothetical protein THAOC_15193 [Thalassiosira oceanica]